MRPLILLSSICLAVILPSVADAKKQKKDDTPLEKLTCKQISGRMQITIVELRGFKDRDQASILSRGIQTGLAATFGNLSHGADPQGEYDAKITQLRQFNQRLVEKNCKSYDLDAELSKNEIDDVPAPTILPPKKPKTPAAATPPAQ